MRAAVLDEGGVLTVCDVAVDAPAAREVLIQVKASGVCHSDLHYLEGSLGSTKPFLMGHEGAGVVLAVGSEVTYVSPGDRVATCVSGFCGTCRYCIKGSPNLCINRPRRAPGAPARLTMDGREVHQLRELGAFAEQMLVHENAVVKLPEGIGFDVACVLGCAVLTGTGAVFNTASVEPGSTVAVIGCGGVGLNVIQGAKLAGAARVIAVDRVESKLELARLFGATDLVNAAQQDSVEAIRALTDGGVDYSFEVIGRPVTAEQSIEMLAIGGTATIVGVMSEQDMFSVRAWTLLRDRKVQGCTMGSNQFRLDIPMLAELYLQGRLELDSLITSRYSLDKIHDAFAALERGADARVILVFDDESTTAGAAQ